MSESDDRLATAVRYGDGWQQEEDYPEQCRQPVAIHQLQL